MRRGNLTVSLAFGVGMVISQSAFVNAATFEECRRVADNVERLACFDKIISENGLSNEAKRAEADLPFESSVNIKKNDQDEVVVAGYWEVTHEKDPITDNSLVYARVVSNNTDNHKMFGKEKELFSLAVRCRNNKTDVIFRWNRMLGFDLEDSIKMSYRIGAAKSQEMWLDYSTDKKAGFVRKPIDFIRRIVKEDEMYIRLHPKNDREVNAKVFIRGIEVVSEIISKECGWKIYNWSKCCRLYK